MAGRRARIFFRSRIVALSLILTCCSAEVSYSDPPKSSQLSEELDFFETKIRPVLAKHCYECHSESSSELQGGLRVDTREGLRIGGDSGPAVVPGNAAQSLLLSAIRFQGLEMPPEAKLDDVAIANIQRWIETGATDPRDGAATLPASALNIQKSKGFWSFQPIQVPALPRVRNRSWPTSPIDYFILAKLESSGLEPAPPADKSELVRRVYFDLHGLPPKPMKDSSMNCLPAHVMENGGGNIGWMSCGSQKQKGLNTIERFKGRGVSEIMSFDPSTMENQSTRLLLSNWRGMRWISTNPKAWSQLDFIAWGRCVAMPAIKKSQGAAMKS